MIADPHTHTHTQVSVILCHRHTKTDGNGVWMIMGRGGQQMVFDLMAERENKTHRAEPTDLRSAALSIMMEAVS